MSTLSAQTKRELEEEAEANQFALCLLMPEKLVHRECDKMLRAGVVDEEGIRSLAALFQVSEVMMTIRLSQLGRINMP